MVNVVLGSKAKNYSFDVAAVDLQTLKGTNPDYTISGAGEIKVSESRSDYVILSGSFKLTAMMSGDFERGIKQLNGIKVVENGVVSYTATGLGMDGAELVSGAAFKDFLAVQVYSIKGNDYGNSITSAGFRDTIHGMGGNDKIHGMAGIDKLYGDDGEDRLFGGTGKDLLTGGKGADVFVFEAGDGKDIIEDFQASGKGQDHIDLSHYDGVKNFAHLDISRDGKSVLIDLGHDTILLDHVAFKDISRADFII